MKSTRRGLFGVVLGAAVSAVGTIMGWGKGGPVPEPKESADHPTPSCVRMWYDDDVEIYPPNVHYQYHSGTLVAITRSLGSKNFHGNTFTYTSSPVVSHSLIWGQLADKL